jgi:hypothetical protein
VASGGGGELLVRSGGDQDHETTTVQYKNDQSRLHPIQLSLGAAGRRCGACLPPPCGTWHHYSLMIAFLTAPFPPLPASQLLAPLPRPSPQAELPSHPPRPLPASLAPLLLQVKW